MATNIHGDHQEPSSSHHPFATSHHPPVQAASPPTKANLKSWWAGFRKETKKHEAQGNYSICYQQESPGGDAFSRQRSRFASNSSKPHAVQFRESSIDEPRSVSRRYASMSHALETPAPASSERRSSLSGSEWGSPSSSSAIERADCSEPELSANRPALYGSLSNVKKVRQGRQASMIVVPGKSPLRSASTTFKAEKSPIFPSGGLQIPLEQSEASDAVLAGIGTPSKAGVFSHLFAVFKIKRTVSFAKLTGNTAETSPGIFGVPLRQSITYANVAISLVDADGKSYIYGYVPIVVAKCGVYLKEKATNVEGIFRLSGSEKRIKELKGIFDAPERYGKGLDWAGYTVHDAANVLRRYLNQLPEPIVPLDLYDRFRDPLRGHTMQAVGDNEGPQLPDSFNVNHAITTYQRLITELPPLNRQLLLYILDLLAVFASKSDENRMNSQNLAAIFQPGMLSHPSHDMAPSEYRLSQDVLIFLIENQDHFLIGMRGTAADEQTVQEVQAGITPPGTPKTGRNAAVVRSTSNASAGAESIRKFGVRRNVSVSSRNSKQSNGAPSPASPVLTHTTTSGLNRSNTVPSRRSPGLPNNKLQKGSGSPSPTGPIFTTAQTQPRGLSPAARAQTDRNPSPSSARFGPGTPIGRSSLAPSSQAESALTSQEKLLADQGEKQDVVTPQKERNVSSFFNRSPTIDGEKKPPNKLRKKQRQPSSNPSAQSSTNSLHAPQAQQSNTSSPAMLPSSGPQDAITERPVLETITSGVIPRDSGNDATDATPPATQTPRAEYSPQQLLQQTSQRIPEQSFHQPAQHVTGTEEHVPQQQSHKPLRPSSSPSSIHSHSSFNDQSDADHREESAAAIEQSEKRSRWRLSRHRDTSNHGNTLSPGRGLGSDTGAGQSSNSIGSASRPRKSFTGDTVPVGSESTLVATHPHSSNESHPGSAVAHEEKKGPLGWIKNKMREKRAESEQKDAEKERNKSPPAPIDRHSSIAPSGKSIDIKRDEFPQRIPEEPSHQQTHEQQVHAQPYSPPPLPQQTQTQQYQPYRPPPAAQEPQQ